MLGARIDVAEASTWNFMYLLSLPDKKKKKQQLWLIAISRADWTETIVNMIAFAAQTSYQKKLNKVLSFVVMGASEDFLHLMTMSCMK